MPHFEQVVIYTGYAASLLVALGVFYVLHLVLWVAFLVCITRRHFDPKTFYEKYDRASVEAMSERGGW